MGIKEMVVQEANNWYERNYRAIENNKDEISRNARIVSDFMQSYYTAFPKEIGQILEVGCSYGYNLNYLSNRFDIECFGIEPSDKAVEYGVLKWGGNPKLHLTQGISDDMPYDNESMNMVLLGFSFYVTPRQMIVDSIREIDRVLKQGGFLVITDFDTPIWYKRVNKHNNELPVYKEDYAQRFLALGYTLAEKDSYSHSGDCFTPDIQERVSTQILFKEYSENLYIQG